MKYFQRDLCMLKEHVSGLQNMFYLKLYIDEHQIHQLSLDWADSGQLSNQWILWPSIQDFMPRIFIWWKPFNSTKALLRLFAILSKIISSHCVIYNLNERPWNSTTLFSHRQQALPGKTNFKKITNALSGQHLDCFYIRRTTDLKKYHLNISEILYKEVVTLHRNSSFPA